MLRKLAPLAVLALALTACSAQPVAEPERSPVVTTKPAPTTAAPSPAAEGVDWLAELSTRYASVERVDEPEPGRVEVHTVLTDPRGEDGSLEANAAIGMCEQLVGLGATYVAIFESDGTTFVLYGHPSYGDVCTEV